MTNQIPDMTSGGSDMNPHNNSPDNLPVFTEQEFINDIPEPLLSTNTIETPSLIEYIKIIVDEKNKTTSVSMSKILYKGLYTVPEAMLKFRRGDNFYFKKEYTVK